MQHGREKIQAVPFYTGLDNFETDQTLVFTTDEELECTDTEWEISDGTKLLIKLAEPRPKEKRRHTNTNLQGFSEEESIPVIHYSSKIKDVAAESVTKQGYMGPTKNGALSELDKRLLEGNSDTQNPQNSPAEMTPSGGALKNILDQNPTDVMSETKDTIAIELTASEHSEGIPDEAGNERVSDVPCCIATYGNEAPNAPQTYSPTTIQECIEFYKEMCHQLAKEKNQLEEDKKYIKQDLKRIQTEIAGNTHSMRALENKMERIEEKKKQIISRRSRTMVSPQESDTIKCSNKKEPKVNKTMRVVDIQLPAGSISQSKAHANLKRVSKETEKRNTAAKICSLAEDKGNADIDVDNGSLQKARDKRDSVSPLSSREASERDDECQAPLNVRPPKLLTISTAQFESPTPKAVVTEDLNDGGQIIANNDNSQIISTAPPCNDIQSTEVEKNRISVSPETPNPDDESQMVAAHCNIQSGTISVSPPGTPTCVRSKATACTGPEGASTPCNKGEGSTENHLCEQCWNVSGHCEEGKEGNHGISGKYCAKYEIPEGVEEWTEQTPMDEHSQNAPEMLPQGHSLSQECPLRENLNEALSSEVKLTKMKHKIYVLEEKMITAKEMAKMAVRDLNESETRVENAEKKLQFFREETQKMKQQLDIHCEENKMEKVRLEEKAMAAETKMSVMEKTVNEIRSELAKMMDATEQEHVNVTEKARSLKAELRKYQKKYQDAKEEFASAQMKFGSQKGVLLQRANDAENKLEQVERAVQTAKGKIKVFEQKFVEVERALCKVKVDAEKEIAGLQQTLAQRTEREEYAERELRMYKMKLKSTEMKLQEANDRVERAQKDVSSLAQAYDTENLLKRKSYDESAILPKILAGNAEESPWSVCEVQKLSTIQDARVATTLMMDAHHCATSWSKDGLSKLESILNGCMKSAKAHHTTPKEGPRRSRKIKSSEDVMHLRSRLEELTSENAELKTSLMESRGEILRSSIVTLERKNSKLRNKVAHISSVQEQKNYPMMPATSMVITNTEGVKKAAHVSRSRESHSASNNHSMCVTLRTKGRINSESAVELQCDEIEGKLMAFISSLKDVQESILQSEHGIPMKVEQWCPVQSPKMTSAAKPTKEYLEKGRGKTRDVLTGLTSQEYMKLQNMKKWLGCEDSKRSAAQLNAACSEMEADQVENVRGILAKVIQEEEVRC